MGPLELRQQKGELAHYSIIGLTIDIHSTLALLLGARLQPRASRETVGSSFFFAKVLL